MRTLYILFIAFLASNAEECDHLWIKYTGNNHPRDYGLLAGYMKPDVPMYVGRGIYAGLPVVGRIQINNPAGLYHVSDWRLHYIVDSAEYLVKNPRYTYEWVPATAGQVIPNIVYPGDSTAQNIFNVGRYTVGDISYFGKVAPIALDPIGHLHYEDENGNEVPTTKFEVLTCKPYNDLYFDD